MKPESGTYKSLAISTDVQEGMGSRVKETFDGIPRCLILDPRQSFPENLPASIFPNSVALDLPDLHPLASGNASDFSSELGRGGLTKRSTVVEPHDEVSESKK